MGQLRNKDLDNLAYLREQKARLATRFDLGELTAQQFHNEQQALQEEVILLRLQAAADEAPVGIVAEVRHYLWGGWRKFAFVAALLTVAGIAVMTRYELVATAHGDRSVVYRLDRWTGGITWCVAAGRCDSLQ